ncbi:lipase [Rhizocola hellebori]|uniref:Lipase n=1 Tax=Rhizocola hellebori TaxID=1392758 RepID=A0A8J3Q4B2_9ACTN|nr:lipase family protein [Rhizocola hellebori]GIH03436.1 lipase [Rhizocola hellebori]
MLAARRWLTPLMVIAALLTASCDSAGTEVQPTPTSNSVVAASGPQGEAFYQPPAPPAGAKPGDLIWARPYSGLKNTTGYQILYWSQTINGELVATSGVAFWPVRPRPEPRAIVAWAPGTAGLGDQCAPSKWEYDQESMAKSVAGLVVKSDAIFVATDYQGLGTPGEHPYLVGHAEGRDVLNAIRAAAKLTETANPTAVVLGESQGGGASLFAAELAPTYAPDVKLAGVAAVAPPSDLATLASALNGSKYFGYTLMTINGIGTAYPAAVAPQDALTAAGKQALSVIREECSDVILTRYAGKKQDEFGVGPILSSAEFLRRLQDNEPGRTKTSVPILIVQGEADDTIPVAGTRKLVQAYCAAGVPLTAMFLPGKGHADSMLAAMQDIVPYLTARINGEPASSTCG